MVATVASTNSRKRKKTEDMVDSPPKRVTRARAAKATEGTEAAPRPTRIKAASARIASEAKNSASTKASRVSKRKKQAGDNEDDQVPEEKEMKETIELSKTRGRPKRSVEPTKQAVVTASTTRTRRNKPVENETQPAPLDAKTKTRSYKDAERIAHESRLQEPEEISSELIKKTTRARAASTNTRSTVTITSKPTRAKKKVAFQEPAEQDKENIAVSSEAKKPTTRGSGIKAKPVRKPPVRGSARGRTVARKTAENEEPAPQPLSPKKVTQVAKSNSGSSEDELCKKIPIKALHKSPVKAPQRKTEPFSSARDPSPCSPSRSRSPIKEATETVLSSPARRLPPSPFKDALKESPRKFAITSPSAQPAAGNGGKPQSSFKNTLKQSPKRVNIIPFQPILTATTRTCKESLHGSPARRPMSAMKVGTYGSPSKSAAALSLVSEATISKETNPFKFSAASPQRLFGNPIRRARVPETSIADQTPSAMGSERENAEECVTVTNDSNLEETVSKAPDNDTCTSPSAHEQNTFRNTFGNDLLFRSAPEESDSEDELQTGKFTMTSPSRGNKRQSRGFISDATPSAVTARTPRSMFQTKDSFGSDATDFSVTPLALQFNAWLAPSPVKNGDEIVSPPRGIFAHVGSAKSEKNGTKSSRQSISSPIEPRFFEDQMELQSTESIQVLEDKDLHEACDVIMGDKETEAHASQHLELYGDENAVPVDAPMLVEADQPAETQEEPEPATVTPTRLFQSNPREIHTVSKVPLRPPAEDSPLKMPRKRSKSAAGPLAELSAPSKRVPSRSVSASYAIETDEEANCEELATPRRKTLNQRRSSSMPMTPANDVWPGIGTPFKTIRKGADAYILRGAVVFVDVYTTEGADASGLFVELLTQMGAKCVKQWTWNPRTGVESSTKAPLAAEVTPGGKVGITHVVYKDGGKRTLQKIRESKGLVLCVGVGWVLE